ncbi:YbjN domain-containing protein [Leptolyngbya sp. CCY15150]|uniref:YbjN domain-containing protein n=1 Tax=Leptolyngbya sp. CCY15150 TaxID=2767772 RepID=UPI00194EEEBF|nr:YbjN domain-containing protein [Leptolyngbya sp. CCY15150]
MTARTETCYINANLTLYDASNSPLTVYAVNLTLPRKDDEIIECRLTFKTDFKVYQHIDIKALFNLESDARISGNSCKFQKSLPIQIEVSLKPDLLPHLQKHATSANEAAAYLLNQCQLMNPDQSELVKTEKLSDKPKLSNFLLATESWLVLSVRQSQKSGEVGYRTIWSYSSSLGTSVMDSSHDGLIESVTALFQDLGINDLPLGNIAKEIAVESISQFADLLKITGEDSSILSSEELNDLLQSTESDEQDINDFPNSQSILGLVTNFLKDNNFNFSPIMDLDILQLSAQGKNGRYNCFAQAIEEKQQLIFYSVCLAQVPLDKRRAIAEFITRANYGLIIGNFEMDWSDGQIRYKTSIDVEGGTLTTEMVKQLVYVNVLTIDSYLPGLVAIAQQNLDAQEAIALVESEL